MNIQNSLTLYSFFAISTADVSGVIYIKVPDKPIRVAIVEVFGHLCSSDGTSLAQSLAAELHHVRRRVKAECSSNSTIHQRSKMD